MDALDNEMNSLGGSQESRESSDGCADFSSGVGGMGFGLGYEIGDEGHEALRRISELYDKLHEVEFPAIAGILETNKQVQAITRSFSQSNSVRQLASLQKSLVTPEMIQSLALSQSVRQSADAVWIESVGKTLDQVFSNAAFQSMNAFSEAVSANIAQVADAMSRYGRGIADFDQFGIAASAALAPMLDSLKRMNFEFDWDGALRLHEMWGSYGWVVIDSMPAMGPKGSPSTWQEANRIAGRYLKDDAVEDIRRKLRAIVRKRIDLEEAFLLYDEKRYKPCAMMLTSLIDCELYKKAKKPEKKDGRRWSREPIKRMVSDAPQTGYLVLAASGILQAYEFYYGDAHDFSKEYRRELNRNFLMHGMHYGKVTQLSCKKLMALLLSVARLMQLV